MLPTDARQWLPPDHLVWHYLALADELDLTAMRAAYRSDGQGHPPYDPAMMVVLLLYCAHRGWHHARDIADNCVSDLGCRIITGNRFPSHETINRFRRRHRVALRGLLAHSVRLCDQAGLVDLSVIAGDGTKVAANASMQACLDADKLTERVRALTAAVAEYEAAWQASIAGDVSQPPLFDLDDAPAPTGHGPAWRRLYRAQRALTTHQAALAAVSAMPDTARQRWRATRERAQANLAAAEQRLADIRAEMTAAADRRAEREAAGARVPGTRPVPVEQHTRVRKAIGVLDRASARAQKVAAIPMPKPPEINITDPSSRIMPAKHGGYDQLFNVEATACASQVILSIIRHPNPNDVQALRGLLHATRATCNAAGIDRPIGTAVFDAGYASDDNFTAKLPVTTLLVALTSNAPNPDRQRNPPDTPPHREMAARLADPANRAAMRQRSGIIEPVFAQLFQQFGRTLTLRGDEVDTELHLWAASHNLAKLIRHRTRR
jgi:transposase